MKNRHIRPRQRWRKQQPFIQTSRNMKMDFSENQGTAGPSSDKPLTSKRSADARGILFIRSSACCKAGFLPAGIQPVGKGEGGKERARDWVRRCPSPKDSEGDKVCLRAGKHWLKKEKWRRGTFQRCPELPNKDSQDTAGLTAVKSQHGTSAGSKRGKSPGSVHSSAKPTE